MDVPTPHSRAQPIASNFTLEGAPSKLCLGGDVVRLPQLPHSNVARTKNATLGWGTLVCLDEEKSDLLFNFNFNFGRVPRPSFAWAGMLFGTTTAPP